MTQNDCCYQINKMKKIFIVPFLYLGMLLQFSCTTTAGFNKTSTDTALFDAGASPKLISRQFSFTEGPAADKNGNVYFTDQPNNTIWKWDTKGNLDVFKRNAGRSNGLYFDQSGALIACADEHNQLWKVNRKGKIDVLLKDYNGKKFNGPNDVWVHPSGNLYFTDPYYQRPYWTRTKPEMEHQQVFLLGKNGTEAVAVIKNLKQPNGIIGTPDGKWLYVADIGAWKTYKYPIHANGTLGEGVLFAEMGSDGMAIDERGNIYLTGNGVTVFAPNGKQVAHIPVPEKWTANVTFGGKNRNQLFITASEAIYILEMNVHGVR